MSAGADGCWVKVEEGHEHSMLKGYVLRITEEDEPRWVNRASAAVYASRGRGRGRSRASVCCSENSSARACTCMLRVVMINLKY